MRSSTARALSAIVLTLTLGGATAALADDRFIYTTTILTTSGAGIDYVEPRLSVNKNGVVAFVGTTINGDGRPEESLYTFDARTGALVALVPSAYRRPSDDLGPSRQQFGWVHIDDRDTVLAHRLFQTPIQVPCGSAPSTISLTYLEEWLSTVAARPTGQVAMGNSRLRFLFPIPGFCLPGDPVGGILPTPIDVFSPIDAIYPFVSRNNLGQVAFAGLIDFKNYRVTAPHTPIRFLGGETPNLTVHPALADSGRYVFSNAALTPAGATLYTEGHDFSGLLALTDGKFSEIGSRPAISEDGVVAVFYGNLTAAGAATLGTYAGPGIFAATAQRIVRVAGVQSDTGEYTSAGAPIRLSSFLWNGPLAVAELSDQRKLLTGVPTTGFSVAFTATTNQGAMGIFTVAVGDVASSTTLGGLSLLLSPPVVSSPLRVASAGDRLPTGSVIDEIALGDSFGANGELVYWARTGGTTALVRAVPPRQIIFLDVANPPPYRSIQGIPLPIGSGFPVARNSLEAAMPDVIAEVRRIYATAGLNIPIVKYTGAIRSDDYTYVRFSGETPMVLGGGCGFPSRPGPLLGVAYPRFAVDLVSILRKVDRFDSHRGDQVAIFVNAAALQLADTRRVAAIIAHESGHSFGLLHVNPYRPDNRPGDFTIEIMDYDSPGRTPISTLPGLVTPPYPDVEEAFTNEVAKEVEPPLSLYWLSDPACYASHERTVTHNNVYHLRRYVMGESDASLRSAGILPGIWDVGTIERFRMRLRGLPGLPSLTELFNVVVVASDGEAAFDGGPVPVFFAPRLDVASLANLSATLEGIRTIEIRASTTADSDDLDVYVSTDGLLGPSIDVSRLGTVPASLVRVVAGTPTIIGHFELDVARTTSDTTATVGLGDVDGNGVVDCMDLDLIRKAFGVRAGQARYSVLLDINVDGLIDIRDLAIASRNVAAGAACR